MWDNLWTDFKRDCKINRLQDIVAVDNLSTRECETDADRGKRQQKSGKQSRNQEKEGKNKKLYTIKRMKKNFSTFDH